jgi:2-polyprenyl-3-methyl-5-hydroxy-6-metoxy-1,4-benzoquinol methylase
MVDLGMSPLCETFPGAAELDCMEAFYPLRVMVCEHCFLAQLRMYVSPAEIFREYAYYSSYSDSWVEHARRYAARMIGALGLGPQSLVIEIASNDGYLLQHFVRAGVPVLGIEPARNVARAAAERGVVTLTEFFGATLAQQLATEGRRADLLIGNNVLAHVPDLNDFVAGLAEILAPGGLLTMEFPHVQRLLEGNQFDTIYHEHFSYFSLTTATRVFAAHELKVIDVEELPTHGGSLRVHVRRSADGFTPTDRYAAVLAGEESAGMRAMATYRELGARAEAAKRDMLDFLITARRTGKRVVGYGAPGKANTFLNYCGIRTDLVEYTVDRNPYKHGRFTPGTHIPIHPPERIAATRPDYIWILPWNLSGEIERQLAYAREWGCQFVLAIPHLRVF